MLISEFFNPRLFAGASVYLNILMDYRYFCLDGGRITVVFESALRLLKGEDVLRGLALQGSSCPINDILKISVTAQVGPGVPVNLFPWY